MPKIMTQPSEKSVFLIAAGGVTLAIVALLFVPSPKATAGNGGAVSASQPASQPASGITPKPAETTKIIRPQTPANGQVTASDFPFQDYEILLRKFQDEEGLVDYAALANAGKNDLEALVNIIAETDLNSLSQLRDAEYSAWYINAYNILTLKTIVDHYPLKSIMDIDQPWDTPLIVAGRELTLNQIEHDVLRLQNSPTEERRAFVDPSLHFAVNCASIGCPRLQDVPFTQANLQELYLKGARDFVANPVQFQFTDGEWKISQLMDWYGDDFTLHYAGESAALAKTLAARGVDQPEKLAAVAWYFSGIVKDQELAKKLREGNYDVTWMEYDWNLNKQP